MPRLLFLSFLSFSFAAALVLLFPPSASALLLGDTIEGSLEFNGFSGINFFDPANGQVPTPPGSSGAQPFAVVSDSDAAFSEFEYSDGTCALCLLDLQVDVDASSITIRESLIQETVGAFGIHGWSISLTDLDWSAAPSVQILSSDFAGLDVSLAGGALDFDYAGGEDIDPFSASDPRSERVAVISFGVIPIPEPTSGALVIAGLLGLAARRRVHVT